MSGWAVMMWVSDIRDPAQDSVQGSLFYSSGSLPRIAAELVTGPLGQPYLALHGPWREERGR